MFQERRTAAMAMVLLPADKRREHTHSPLRSQALCPARQSLGDPVASGDLLRGERMALGRRADLLRQPCTTHRSMSGRCMPCSPRRSAPGRAACRRLTLRWTCTACSMPSSRRRRRAEPSINGCLLLTGATNVRLKRPPPRWRWCRHFSALRV